MFWQTLAHQAHDFREVVTDGTTDLSALNIRTVVYALIALLVLTGFALISRRWLPKKLKLPLYVMMVTTMLGSMVVILGSTIYLNSTSDTKGPVHWHADLEIWACGNQLELRDPSGFSNRGGSPLLHEHDDQRLHVEGVVVDQQNDVTLGKLIREVGGIWTAAGITVPLNKSPEAWFEDKTDGDGLSAQNRSQVEPYIATHGTAGVLAKLTNGSECGKTPSEVQAFVYRFDEKNQVYSQDKLASPTSYLITKEELVPPGDCIIIEFGPVSDRTDKLCQQYGVRDKNLCESFGVPKNKLRSCDIQEVTQ